MKFNVYYDKYCIGETVIAVEADTKAKAVYQCYKQLRGIEWIEKCSFMNFIKYFFIKIEKERD